MLFEFDDAHSIAIVILVALAIIITLALIIARFFDDDGE